MSAFYGTECKWCGAVVWTPIATKAPEGHDDCRRVADLLEPEIEANARDNGILPNGGE